MNYKFKLIKQIVHKFLKKVIELKMNLIIIKIISNRTKLIFYMHFKKKLITCCF